jgi:LysM repeat protein
MRWMRLFYYLSINVIVSALTTLMVLVVWEQIHKTEPIVIGPEALQAAGQAALPTLAWTPLISETPTPEISTSAILSTTTPSIPTPVRLSGVITHTVKTGETLGIIAGIYGVTVEDIMASNRLDDPNLVEIGQKLRIRSTTKHLPPRRPDDHLRRCLPPTKHPPSTPPWPKW